MNQPCDEQIKNSNGVKEERIGCNKNVYNGRHADELSEQMDRISGGRGPVEKRRQTGEGRLEEKVGLQQKQDHHFKMKSNQIFRKWY